jgi:hypothetical protein
MCAELIARKVQQAMNEVVEKSCRNRELGAGCAEPKY